MAMLDGGVERCRHLRWRFSNGSSGDAIVVQGAALTETAGSFGTFLVGTSHRFHTVHVTLNNASGANHALCGVEVNYQVPVSANPGVSFFPISPVRAFDSRNAAYGAEATVLAPNGVKIISIADGHALGSGAVDAPNVVPADATAITYNITVTGATGPNFVAVTPGDSINYAVSTINFNGLMDVANGSTVGISAARTIKVFGGDQTGSMHIIIDVTGYYAPYTPPNMGN